MNPPQPGEVCILLAEQHVIISMPEDKAEILLSEDHIDYIRSAIRRLKVQQNKITEGLN